MEMGAMATGLHVGAAKTGSYGAAAADTRLMLGAFGRDPVTRAAICSAMARLHMLQPHESDLLKLFADNKRFGNVVATADVLERPPWALLDELGAAVMDGLGNLELGDECDRQGLRALIVRLSIICAAFIPKESASVRFAIFAALSRPRAIDLGSRLAEIYIGLRVLYRVPAAPVKPPRLFHVSSEEKNGSKSPKSEKKNSSKNPKCKEKNSTASAAVKDESIEPLSKDETIQKLADDFAALLTKFTDKAAQIHNLTQ